jgi:hypothetical protein
MNNAKLRMSMSMHYDTNKMGIANVKERSDGLCVMNKIGISGS